jgi:DNA repair protein RecN (Recombination protein N)
MDQLGLVEKELAAAAALDGTLQNILQQISSAAEQLMDAARELRYYQEELNLDETELQEVSERLETYRRIKQKYGPTISDVEKLAADMQQELAALTGRSAQREELAEKIAATEAALAQAAAELTVLRQQTAEKLSSRINGALQELALQGAKFNILVAPAEQCSIHGCDKIEFQLSANTGEPFHSLAKTASGGEISRVMLAVKSVLAAEDAVDTLIFDEIDAGIGGLTVRAVAEKLKSLAAHRQVICVTHQPLIAAAADHHFYIYKESTNSRTATRLKKLSPGEREQELARMLGGEDGVALQHAQELLAEYQKL